MSLRSDRDIAKIPRKKKKHRNHLPKPIIFHTPCLLVGNTYIIPMAYHWAPVQEPTKPLHHAVSMTCPALIQLCEGEQLLFTWLRTAHIPHPGRHSEEFIDQVSDMKHGPEPQHLFQESRHAWHSSWTCSAAAVWVIHCFIPLLGSFCKVTLVN